MNYMAFNGKIKLLYISPSRHNGGNGLMKNTGLDNDGRSLCDFRTCTALEQKIHRISFTIGLNCDRL